MWEYDIEIMILEISKIVYIFNNYITIYLLFAHFIKSNNNYIYQPNNTNIIIFILGILNR